MKHIALRLKDIVLALGCEVLKPFKVSFIVGSHAAFFSLAQCSFPLIGFYGGRNSAFMAFFVRTLYALARGFPLYAGLFYHIPALYGSLYLASSSKLVRVALPLVCMLLFLAHPVGAQAPLYTFYWFLPMALAVLPVQSFFLQALGTTFTMHAAGSVLWLYTKPLDPLLWNGLISTVWAERLFFAFCMTAIHYGIVAAKSLLPLVKARFGVRYA